MLESPVFTILCTLGALLLVGTLLLIWNWIMERGPEWLKTGLILLLLAFFIGGISIGVYSCAVDEPTEYWDPDRDYGTGNRFFD